MFIYNFNYAIANNNKQQLGTVTITKDGILKISPNVVRSLTESDLADISRRSLSAFYILKGGDPNQSPFSFTIEKKNDRDCIIYTFLDKSTCIASLLHKNYHLNFQSDIPMCLRALCMQELNNKGIYYYYNGSYRNCKKEVVV